MHMHTYIQACPSVRNYLIPPLGCISTMKIKTKTSMWNFILLNPSDSDRFTQDVFQKQKSIIFRRGGREGSCHL